MLTDPLVSLCAFSVTIIVSMALMLWAISTGGRSAKLLLIACTAMNLAFMPISEGLAPWQIVGQFLANSEIRHLVVPPVLWIFKAA